MLDSEKTNIVLVFIYQMVCLQAMIMGTRCFVLLRIIKNESVKWNMERTIEIKGTGRALRWHGIFMTTRMRNELNK